jgi:hypothetical protein
MSFIDEVVTSRSRAACPMWCVIDHDRDSQPALILHESCPVVIEISGPRDADVPERIEVQTTQYSPEDSGELPAPPTVELSRYGGGRYRITTLTADEARRLAASLFEAAAHANGDPHPHDPVRDQPHVMSPSR